MCTVTLIPFRAGYRMMHSRDELRSRAPERAPSWRTLENGLRACWPTDTDAGGTWVGIREDGLSMGLLNLNAPDEELDPGRPRRSHISRGMLIPRLMESLDACDAIDRLAQMDLRGMSPFRLLLVGPGTDGRCVAGVVRFGGVRARLVEDLGPLQRPRCLASSGLGDHLVRCRLPLFAEMVGADPTPKNQRAFHFHRWDDRPEYSVLMSRREARTSSVTTVEHDSSGMPRVEYETVPEGCPQADPVGCAMLQ